VAAIRSELQRDIGQVQSGAAQLEELKRIHSRWSKVRWIAVGLMSGAALFASGFVVSLLVR
jgi:hypothetical protein